ncbi:MAG: phosphopantetheine-binding protein [Treponemataceae bacterium]|nr:phosphopantetheine-binding protein [Treponemataceae bacterium]
MNKEEIKIQAYDLNQKRDEVITRIKNVLIHRLNLDMNPEEIDDDSPLFGMGLGLDSIDALELVVGIEEEFGIKVPSERLDIFLSINTIADFILEEPRFAVQDILFSEELISCKPWLNVYKALREGALMYTASPSILEVSVQDGGLEFVSWLISGNDTLLEPFKALHTLILNESGNVVDLVYVIMFDEKIWLLPTSENKESVSWIMSKAAEKSVVVQDISKNYVQVICEGPYSWKMVKSFAGFEVIGLSYLRAMYVEWEGDSILVLRGGRSNEYGFRIFISPHLINKLTEHLLKNAEGINFIYETDPIMLNECLIAASQEVRFPVLDVTIKKNASPIPYELRWMIATKKDSFIGKESVLEEIQSFSKRVVAIVSEEKGCKDETSWYESEVIVGDEKIGTVIFCNYSPLLDRWFGYAELLKEYGYAGNHYYRVKNKNGEEMPVASVSTPLFLTKSAVVQME